MYRKLTGVLALLGFLSLSGGYRVISNVMDGVPEFVNINPAPFVKIGNGYYYIENKLRKNWFDAYESCSRMGAALISFETIEKWNLINKYLKDEKIDYFYWTSGTDLAKQDKHVWLSTGNPIALDIWHPSQPDNKEGVEHCDEMGWRLDNTTYTGLNDAKCTSPEYYICEAPQPKTASFIVW